MLFLDIQWLLLLVTCLYGPTNHSCEDKVVETQIGGLRGLQ